MVSQAEENVELVRRGYEAFNTADMAALTALFDEDASWHTPGRSSIAGDAVGRDAVFARFGRYGGERNGKQLEVDFCAAAPQTGRGER